jgi:6-pyruvoyltetrahydropterin/6-carboxytetrahydropterin synthase
MTCYIYIDGWKANIRFSSAHIIPEYEKCGRLHGHTYAIHVKITGEPDDKGIIIDFSLLKKILKNIANNLDHKNLIPKNSNFLKISNENDSIKINTLNKKYIFPKNDCLILPIKSTSAENLSKYVLNELIKELSDLQNINEIEVGIDEGYGQGARIIKIIKR